MTNSDPSTPALPRQRKAANTWVYEVLLLLVLLIGAYLRLAGAFWGEYQYLHPDERFLVWVGTDIQPIGKHTELLGAPPSASQPGMEWRREFLQALPDCQKWGGYFDSACSPLNPHNRGHTFYVYGTLPMFLVRYAVEMVYGHSGFAEMTNVGRPLSAVADLLTIFLVYLVASRLYDRRVGILAAAFSTFTVLQIQQSHFFTMDTFINMFTFLAFYFAVRVSLGNGEQPLQEASPEAGESPALVSPPKAAERLRKFASHPYFWLSLAFGVALGMAVASKLNAAPMALALPAAMSIQLVSVPRQKREDWIFNAILYLALGAVVSLLTFRIFQPYAFTGPGFFGLKLNPMWLKNISDLRAQQIGDIDFPPSLQWARRPVWFSGENMILWGLGLPLGILAWGGFLWVGWRMLNGDWKRHALLWGWTAFYFAWQSSIFNPTMRYQLPVYPTLVIFAAWAVVALFDQRKSLSRFLRTKFQWNKILAILVGVVVLAGTAAWAFAFTSIYLRPITRVAASRWIYQNIPGPINLHIQSDTGVDNQIVPFPYQYTIRQGVPYFNTFTATQSGTVNEVYLGHVLNAQATSGPVTLLLTVSALPNGQVPLGSTIAAINPFSGGQDYILVLPEAIQLAQNQVVYLTIEDLTHRRQLDLCGDLVLYIQTSTDLLDQDMPAPGQCTISPMSSFSIRFSPQADGKLAEIYFSHLTIQETPPSPVTLAVQLFPKGQNSDPATASLTSEFLPGKDGLGMGYNLSFDRPVSLEKGEQYQVGVIVQSGSDSISIQGSAVANEGDWDDGLPVRLDNYDGFGGIYIPDLNFNMYTDETTEKLQHFLQVLDTTEYILISSNRQWASLPRLPERFPMSTVYYRNLLGCPEERDILDCYVAAKPGMFKGNLGFELVKVFQSDPALGPFSINDQSAEEAFTVYDHPKVLIFRKTDGYDPQKVKAILGAVDFSQVVRITPKKAGSFPADLKLPLDRLSEQLRGGTWSALFNRQALQNLFQPAGVVIWYLSVWLLGLIAYPILRLALPGLSDRGYPLARTAGMLTLSYLTWLAGSFRLPADRPVIIACLGGLVVLSAVLAYFQRDELRQEWRERRRYFLMVEGLFLAFFLLFLLVRMGNPDLWHQWKGGEKPMDFSYFNAVLKSTTFPPYDPWFAGGYLNYYYYGFVFSGVLVKLLGFVPSFAYNLILPTMFSLTAMGAFSIAWNLFKHKPFLAGLAGSFLMTVLGNLGTLRMIFRGYQILVDPNLAQEGASLIYRWSAAIQGIGRAMSGEVLPYSLGDWYWNPSRVMPPGDNAITEFPAFTFLYADPHAHLFALPIALLCLGWILSVLLGRARWKNFGAAGLSFILGGLFIGALWPTNTWDYPTYLALGAVALAYTLWRYLPVNGETFQNSPFLRPLARLPVESKRLLVILVSLGSLFALSRLLYQPYIHWYGLGYTKLEVWTGPVTPLGAYFTHWGLFLFLIATWMVWETRDWMASTPASSLRKLEPYWTVIWISLVVLLVIIFALVVKLPVYSTAQPGQGLPIGRGVGVAVIALPLAAWAGILLLRPGLPDSKRAVLFMVGTAMVITLLVELIVLRGDIGRQNTVFKLYLQAWTLLAICAAGAFGWLLASLHGWSTGWRTAWQVGLILLVASAALFPLLGGTAKIRDRMAQGVLLTLDGMDYMRYAQYDESGHLMDLSQDYWAIRWMQENVQGSPVIVEANSGNLYRWYSRFTIYTGLPGVLGWEWHEQQQRAITPPDWVSNRLSEITTFYLTPDVELAREFLRKYNVKYIIVGQLERATYDVMGLDKFPALEGQLWRTVYHEGDTVIYEVIDK